MVLSASRYICIPTCNKKKPIKNDITNITIIVCENYRWIKKYLNGDAVCMMDHTKPSAGSNLFGHMPTQGRIIVSLWFLVPCYKNKSQWKTKNLIFWRCYVIIVRSSATADLTWLWTYQPVGWSFFSMSTLITRQNQSNQDFLKVFCHHL